MSNAVQPPSAGDTTDPQKDLLKDIQYVYTKQRKDFGRQERFLQDHYRVHASIKPLQKYRKQVLKKNIIDKEVQAVKKVHLSEMNTVRIEYGDASFYHSEGGWPKDINLGDPEMVQRYKKKLEKDDSFLAALPVMADEMEELIKNNNTINFYRNSYQCENIVGSDGELVPSATVVSLFRNNCPMTRRVSRISFAPDNAGRIAVAQCPYEFDPYFREHSGDAYFWEVENPTRPEGIVRAGSPIVDVRYHPKDLHTILGALFTGQVAVWDNRVSPNPQGVSEYEVSHRDVCTSAVWINSKTGTEFMSCGLDGQIIWWDERNMSQALDTVWCDPEKGQCRPEYAHGATILEYEHTLPTKFLAGTELGELMVFMKKGKTPNERMIHLYKAHKGPITACHRNPMFIKNLLTVGDYQLRIFAEDCKESNISWTIPSAARYADANWNPMRPSSFVACRSDGVLEWWDLLIRGAGNVMSLQVGDEPLTAVCVSDTGKHVAVGTIYGDVKLVKVSDFMGEFSKEEKTLLAGFFDRESRREKYLEQRNREIRLKKRDQEKQEAIQKKLEEDEAAERVAAGFPESVEGMDPLAVRGLKIRQDLLKNPIVIAEQEFFKSIEEEIKTKGVDAFPDQVLESKGRTGSDTTITAPSSAMITAEDLAAFDFDEPDADQPGTAEAKPSEQAATAPPAAPAAEQPPPPPPPAEETQEEDEEPSDGGEESGMAADDEEE